jgi:hypothetical protein
MSKMYYPPRYFFVSGRSIFLAGTIDGGDSYNWQEEIAVKCIENNYNVFNPRRLDFNKDLEQSVKNPDFVDQVNWGLDYIDNADIVAFYFAIDSRSPITLLELGLTLANDSAKCVVYCPHGFWRKGNVDIVCARHKVKVFEIQSEWEKELFKNK